MADLVTINSDNSIDLSDALALLGIKSQVRLPIPINNTDKLEIDWTADMIAAYGADPGLKIPFVTYFDAEVNKNIGLILPVLIDPATKKMSLDIGKVITGKLYLI